MKESTYAIKTKLPERSSRVISLVLVLCMLFSLLPLTPSANAAGVEAFSAVNQVAQAYLDASQSYDLNNRATVMTNYDRQETDYRKDTPSGYSVQSAAGGTITVTGNGSVWEDATPESSYTIYNLVPGITYHYVTKDVSQNIVAEGNVQPTGALRMIYSDSPYTYNMRDLGGWTCDGGTIKYGKLFRGANLDNPSAYNIKVLHDYLGIRQEIDLRDASYSSESKLGADVDRLNVTLGYVNFNDTASNRENLKTVMELIMDNAINDVPTYFHCIVGADRTATIAFLIEAVLGVDPLDLARDFELTSFTLWKADNNERLWTANAWPTRYSQIEEQAGDTYEDKAATFLFNCGISYDKINAFRNAMIDGNPRTLEPSPIKEGIYEENGILTLWLDGKRVTAKGLYEYNGKYYFNSSDTSKGLDRNKNRDITGYSNGLMPDGVYYFGDDGAMVVPETKDGVVSENGVLHLYINGAAITAKGLYEYDGKLYFNSSDWSKGLDRNAIRSITDAYSNGLVEAGTYYFGNDGAMVDTGVFVNKSNDLYYYVENGRVSGTKGVLEWDGKHYYVTSDNSYLYKNTVVNVSSSTNHGIVPSGYYKCGPDAAFDYSFTGYYETSSTRSYWIENGKGTAKGVFLHDGEYYFAGGNGIVTRSADVTVTEAKANGLLPAGTYAADETGKLQISDELREQLKRTGMIEEDGKLYLYTAGEKQTGFTGLYTDPNTSILYYVEKGVGTAKGVVESSGAYYFAEENGVIAVNKSVEVTEENGNQLLNPKQYSAGSDGKLNASESDEYVKEGVFEENGVLYLYLNGSKVTKKGLYEWNGNLYFNSSDSTKGLDRNSLRTVEEKYSNGLIDDPGSVLLFGDDGAMVTGTGIFPTKNGPVYVENSRCTYGGLIFKDGYFYYAKSTGPGYLAVNTNYNVSVTNGLMPSGTYHFDAQGRMTNPPDITIRWVVDGNLLETDIVPMGTMAEYNGSEPERAKIGGVQYRFSGWDKEPSFAMQDETYVATFEPVDAQPYAFVRSLLLSEVRDGSGAFDLTDTPGNDSSATNHVVRTFDTTSYLVEISTEPLTTTDTYKNGLLYLDVELDKDITEARFEMSAMQWTNNYDIIYYDAGGQVLAAGHNSMPDYNANEHATGSDAGVNSYRTPVAKQVLRAEYYLVGDNPGATVIPGTKNLNVVIRTLVAKNGDTMAPKFTAHVAENEQNVNKSGTADPKTITSPVITVSAKPRYDVFVMNARGLCNVPGRYDLKTGQAATASSDPANTVTGNMVGYGLELRLYNETDNPDIDLADKGRMGIEYPQGPISFQIDFSEAMYKNKGPVPSETGFTPLLWDYRNTYDNDFADVTGKLGRNMKWRVSETNKGRGVVYSTRTPDAYHCYYETGKIGNEDAETAYNSGTWNLQNPKEELASAYSGATSPVYTFTVSDYDFELDKNLFPIAARGDTVYEGKREYLTYLGAFSSAYIEVLMQYDKSQIEEETYLYMKAAAHDMSASSISGDSVDYETTLANNTHATNYLLTIPGTFNKGNSVVSDLPAHPSYGSYYASKFLGLGSYVLESYDAAAYSGDNIYVLSYYSLSTDSQNVITDANLLQKFDSSVYTIRRDADIRVTATGEFGRAMLNKNPSIKHLYAADPLYPNGLASNNPEEMARLNNATEEDLLYFDSLDALESAGYTCIGILTEVRDAEWDGGSSIQVGLPVTISDDPAFIGKTYASTNRARAWMYNRAHDMTWENGTYDFSTHKNTDPSYVKQDYIADQHDYVKSEFDNGILREGTHRPSYYHGMSLLVIGYESKISIYTDKDVYDMDKGERTATYTLAGIKADVSSTDWVRRNADTVKYTNLEATVDLNDYENFISSSFNIDGVQLSKQASAPTVVPYTFTDAKGNVHNETYKVWVEQVSAKKAIIHMEDVAVTADLKDIKFSARIGYPGQVNDVVNNQMLEVVASITGDSDNRAIKDNAGNRSEETIQIVRLTTTGTYKEVDKTLVEENEEFTYTISYNNFSNAPISEMLLYDVLPFNGDDRGTAFHGDYKVTSITANIEQSGSDADSQTVTLYYSTADPNTIDTSASGWAEFDTMFANAAGGPGGTVVFNNAQNADITAIGMRISKIAPLKKVTLTFTVQPNDNKALDLYGNNAHSLIVANGPESALLINTVQTEVVSRQISGLVWMDYDRDGLQGRTEERVDGAQVSLLKWNDSTNAYEPLCYRGTSIPMVIETGSAVSYYGTSTLTSIAGGGGYSFEDLPSGRYAVRFEDGTTVIRDFQATDADVGSDDTIDSDATGHYDGNGSMLYASITDVSLPPASEMQASVYRVDDLDLGLKTAVDFRFTKVDAKNLSKTLSGAEFKLTYGSYSNNTYTWNGEVSTASSGANGVVLFEGLRNGVYKLEETKAPNGYLKPDGYWIVTVDASNKANPISIVGVDTPNAFAVSGSEFKLPNSSATSIPFTGNNLAFLLPGASAAALLAMFWASVKKRKENVKAK